MAPEPMRPVSAWKTVQPRKNTQPAATAIVVYLLRFSAGYMNVWAYEMDEKNTISIAKNKSIGFILPASEYGSTYPSN